MPSPFPGMDPYLEDPGLWPDVHHELISTARHMLTERLRPRYSVRIEDRVYISDDNDPGRQVIIPDLRILRRSVRAGQTPPGGTATAAVVEPIETIRLIEEEIHESRIEVIDRKERLVVTVIEILSPASKVAGSQGRASYDHKRREVIGSPSHFIEIDLLRAGARFSPFDMLGRHDYRIHLSRAQRRPKGTLWPIRLDQRLPVIPIPLLGDEADAELDLQAGLDRSYDLADYGQEVDYRIEPLPPLAPEQAQWAESILRERGLR